jgi:hypothetical protein
LSRVWPNSGKFPELPLWSPPGRSFDANLARISSIMTRLALAFSPEEKDEKGNPCRPHWPNIADEARFLRFMGLAYDCDKARAPYESPRATPGDQAVVEDPSDDPHARLPPSGLYRPSNGL